MSSVGLGLGQSGTAPSSAAAADAILDARFRDAVRSNPAVAALLARLPALELPDCWLVAGCLFQAVWNTVTGRPAAENVNDYDVFYHDATDLSYEAEDRVIRRVTAAMADLNIRVETRNQARVHLWYEARFGAAYPALQSAQEGIDRFLVAGTCVALGCAPANRELLYAPYGLTDIFDGVLRPNLLSRNPARYAQKCASYQVRWPHLRPSDEPATLPAGSPCQACGACCAYRADWPRFSLETDEELARIPEVLVAADGSGMGFQHGRCRALCGTVGKATACGIYAVRPIVCRDCQPGDDACTEARLHFGMPPIALAD